MSTLKMITFLTHSAFIEKFEHTSYFQLIRDPTFLLDYHDHIYENKLSNPYIFLHLLKYFWFLPFSL